MDNGTGQTAPVDAGQGQQPVDTGPPQGSTQAAPLTREQESAAALEMFRFNPMDPKQQNKGPGAGPDAGTQGEKTAALQQAAASSPGVQQPSSDAKAQLAAIQQFLHPQPQAPQPGQQQQGQQQQQQQDPFAWKPNWNIPDDLFQAITGPDPVASRQGLNAMVNGIASSTYKQAMTVAHNMVQHYMQSVPQMINDALERQALQNEFYGKYKHLDKPEVKQVVERIAGAEYRKRASLGMQVNVRDPQFQAVVAAMTAEMLGMQVPTGQQPQQPVRRQPFINAGTTRPDGLEQRQEDIGEMMGI